jgi:hypothetical protein
VLEALKQPVHLLTEAGERCEALVQVTKSQIIPSRQHGYLLGGFDEQRKLAANRVKGSSNAVLAFWPSGRAARVRLSVSATSAGTLNR